MSDINTLTVTGRLVRDPIIRHSEPRLECTCHRRC